MARTAAIVLGCAIFLAACSQTNSPPVGTPAIQELSLAQLRNAEYVSQWTRSGRARLVNGQYRESAAPGAATEVIVRATSFYAMGDLDGDGSSDAVIVLESDPGGSGVFFDLVPVLNRQGSAEVLAPVPLGDRVAISSVSVSEREVQVRLLKHGPDDPQCCPTLDVTLHYRLGPRGLVNESQEPNRTSAAPLRRKMVQSLTPTAPMRS